MFCAHVLNTGCRNPEGPCPERTYYGEIVVLLLPLLKYRACDLLCSKLDATSVHLEVQGPLVASQMVCKIKPILN